MDSPLIQSEAFRSTLPHPPQGIALNHSYIPPETGFASTTLRDQQRPHPDDHHVPIQPTTPFRLIDETNNTQVLVTPNKRFRPFQHKRHPDINRGDESPDGGVSIQAATLLDTPTRQPVCHRHHQRTPNFAISPANISVRRSRRTSTLLASPPRPGHSSRLRDIFEDARRDPPRAQTDGAVCYPQLPNVSRTLEHVQLEERDISISRPGSPLPTSEANSAAPNSQPHEPSGPRTTPTPSSTSTGSWSGDSAYLIAEPSPRLPPPSLAPRPHIDDWLSTIALEEDSSRTHSSSLEWPALASSDLVVRHEIYKVVKVADRDDDNNELPPLSPNVRVERGPSRKHCTPNDDDIFPSPMNTPKVTRLLEQEENRVMEDAVNLPTDISPLRTHMRNRTRFWCPIGSGYQPDARSELGAGLSNPRAENNGN